MCAGSTQTPNDGPKADASMPETYRRVILKPAGLPEEQRARFADQLATAVAWQQELAGASPHVLQFLGALRETDAAFVIDHEPAAPLLAPASLFDGTAPAVDTKQLLRLAAAIFDSLKAAHASGKRVSAHGGLCPGILLTTPDGIEKITDFGLAAAICSALSPEQYLNAAVSARTDGAEELRSTGTWEILSPDEYDREDRICAFIDPEKYGTSAHESFESGSDVIAAGFLLHMMAEHRHPYLPDDDAHRLVEMSEFMAMARYNGARRQDLRESSDGAVAAWCEIVANTLGRLPQNRPSAKEVVQSLSAYVKPVDVGEILRRRLEPADELVKQKAWDELRALVKGIAASDDAPPDVVQRANELLRTADASLLLERAVDVLKGEAWRDAKEPLDQVLALPAIPPAIHERAKKASGVLEHSLAADAAFEKAMSRTGEGGGDDPAAARTQVEQTISHVEKLASDERLLPQVQGRLGDVLTALNERLSAINTELERFEAHKREEEQRLRQEREADHEKAGAWLADLDAAIAAAEWEMVPELLDDRPTLTHWPDGSDARVEEIRRALEAHLAEQKRQAAIEADRTAAIEWLAAVRDAVEAEFWDKAEEAQRKRPQLAHWPEDVQAEGRELAEAVRQARRREQDAQRATAWRDELAKHVEAKAWDRAATVLSERPALECWPDDVLEDEKALRAKVESELEAVDLQRRQVVAWIESAQEASAAERWDEAIRVLEAPPVDAAAVPKDVRKQADALRESCRKARAEQLARLVEERAGAVLEAAQAFVRKAADAELSAYLSSQLLTTTLTNEEFDAPDEFHEGTAELSVRVAGDAGEAAGGRMSAPISFERANGGVRIRDNGSLKKQVVDHVKSALKALQKTRLADFAKPLRDGAFPKTQLAVKLAGLSERTKATVCLLGGEAEHAKIKTELEWAPDTLTWRQKAPAEFVKKALDIGAAAAEAAVEKAFLKDTDALRRYEGALAIEVVPTQLPDPARLPEPLGFEGRLTAATGTSEKPRLLCSFTITCPEVGRAAPEPDVREAITALNQLLVETQTRSRDELQKEIDSRIGEAGVKVKVVPSPRRITEPSDEVRFELSRRRHAPVAVAATWNADDFSYAADGDWGEALGDILAPPTRAEKRAGLMPIGVGAAVVVAAVAVAYGLWGQSEEPQRLALVTNAKSPIDDTPTTPSGDGNESEDDRGDPVPTVDDTDRPTESGDTTTEQDPGGPTTPPGGDEDSTNDNGPEPPEREQPTDVAGTPPSIDEAIADIEDILKRCEALSPAAAQLVTRPDAAAVGTPTVTVRVPGLEGASVEVTLEADESGGYWQLSDADAGSLEAKVDSLIALFRALDRGDTAIALGSELGGAVSDARYGSLLDGSRLGFRIAGEPVWVPEGNDLVATEVAGALIQTTVDESFGVEIIPTQVSLRASNGTVRLDRLDAGAIQTARQQIDDAMKIRQTTSSQDCQDALQEKLGSTIGIAALTDVGSGPAQVTEWETAAEGLLPRRFSATWQPEGLSFVLGAVSGSPWTDLADSLISAHDLLAAINTRPDPASDWLGRAVGGTLREVQAPGADGIWLLAVPAPWAVQEGGEPSASDRLVIPVDRSMFETLNTAAAASAFLTGAPPAYWPGVEWYHVNRSAPYYVPPEELGAELRSRAQGLNHLQVRLDVADAPPRLVFQGGGLVPDAIEVTATARWAVRSVPEGLNRGAASLDWAAQVRLPQVACPLTLRGSADGGLMTSGFETAEIVEHFRTGVPEVTALDRLMGQWPARTEIERTFEARLAGQNVLDMSTNAQVADFLGFIWEAKGVGDGTAPALEEVVSTIRGRNGVTRSDKAALNVFKPTIFAEYFCGPTACYALAWSSAPDEAVVKEGPFLIKLGPVAALTGSQTDGLGEALIGAVLSRFRDAVLADDLTDFEKQVGLALAPDEPMALVALSSLQFEPKRSSLRPVKGAGAGVTGEWESLDSLRRRPFVDAAGDFWLLQTLSTPQAEWSQQSDPRAGEALRWALEALGTPGLPAP